MPLAQVAAGHYEPDGTGDGHKRLVNYYSEPNPQDPARPYRLVTTPGTRIIDDATVTAARGVFQADGFASGKLVIPDGSTIRLMDTGAETFTALTGTIAGTDRVQAAFGEVQAGFLAGGNLYASAGVSVAAVSDADWSTLLSDHSQTAFSSITTMGQRLIATYGSRFGFSQTLEFNNTTTLSFYTAESAPDGLVAGYALGAQVYLFGTQTTEIWVETGNGDDPFRPITDQVIRRGAVARDTIVQLDNSLFFIGDDRVVYRLNGLQPANLNVKDPWVTRLLEGVAPEDIVCSGQETDAHSFYIINTPNDCIVYDVGTGQFHKRQTNGRDGWEWQFHKRVGAKHFTSNAGAKIAELSRDYLSDNQADASTFGTEIVREFTAHLPVMAGRREMTSIRLEGTKGVGLLTGQGTEAEIKMAISRDKGITYGNLRTRSLGRQGDYDARTIWRRCGRAKPEQTVMLFRLSDPVKHAFTGVAVNEI